MAAPRKPRETPTKRRCPKCNTVKSSGSFPTDTTRPDGLFPYCKVCHAKYQGNHSTNFQDPEAALTGQDCPVCDTPLRGRANRKYCSAGCKDKVGALAKRFNLSIEEYRSLIKHTEGRCPICLKRPTRWNIDHDHRTNLVTGVVCTRCNTGSLATSFHDVEHVRRLLAYLERPPAVIVLGREIFANPKYHQPSNLHNFWSR